MWKRLHVKYSLFSSDFNETWIFSTDFRKNSNIKFYQNPSSWSRVVACGRTYVRKLTVAFRKFRKRSNAAGCRYWHVNCTQLSIRFCWRRRTKNWIREPMRANRRYCTLWSLCDLRECTFALRIWCLFTQGCYLSGVKLSAVLFRASTIILLMLALKTITSCYHSDKPRTSAAKRWMMPQNTEQHAYGCFSRAFQPVSKVAP